MLAEYDTTAAYQFAPDLISGTFDASDRVVESQPGEAQSERLVHERLGVHVWGRWQYFRQCFSGPWGDGGKRPLSPRAQDAFLGSLSQLNLRHANPSLFLTDEGHLELFWRDERGSPIQIEFGPNESEVYVASDGIEETVPNEALNGFIGEHLAS